jgi:hypothetical protein
VVEVNNTITTLSSFNRDKEVQSRGLRREQKKITENYSSNKINKMGVVNFKRERMKEAKYYLKNAV